MAQRQQLLGLAALLILLCFGGPTVAQRQRNGLPFHKFFINPFAQYRSGSTEVKFTDSEILTIRPTQPVIIGPERTKYSDIFLHKRIPGFVFLRNPNDFPPEVEELYTKPYFKVLNEFRDRAQDEVQFYARSFQNGAPSASCLDKKFASKYKDEANQIFDFGRGGYFSPQAVVAVAFRRAAGQAVGGLAEIVFVNSGFDTVVYMNYANLAPASASAAGVLKAGLYGDSPVQLPDGFPGQSNVAQPGSWVFRTSDPGTPGGVASANVDPALRRSLDRDNERLGFLPDRMLGCMCDRCDARAQCVRIGSGAMRVVEGTTKCCRCQGLNSYVGNGIECSDVGSPLPVVYQSFAWVPPQGATSGGVSNDLQVNVTQVQAKLDVSVQPIPATDGQVVNLVKLSDPAWANLALLTAAAQSNLSKNLFALGDVFERRMEFSAFDLAGTRVAAWTIEQTVWNQVLLKGVGTRLTVQLASPVIASIQAVLTDVTQSAITEYGFTEVQQNRLTLESRPAGITTTVLTLDGLQDLRVNFTDSWSFRPTCDVETRVRRMILERWYERTELPSGLHLTRITGTVTRLVTCVDLSCGVGAECRINGATGQASCHCLAGYRRDGPQPDGPCRAVCGGSLCHEKAECLLNKCMCNIGFGGDGLACSPDPLDCRKPQGACRTEDGSICLQRAAGTGVEYRCQCSSSKCIREADAECRRQAGCSRFADCLPEINQCICKTGFTGDGRLCVPDLCVDNEACADAGPFAFCNTTRQCEVCTPPRVITDGRCQARPCRPSDCHNLAECNPVTNACVCKPGFTGDGVLNCSLACSTLRDCNRDVLDADLADLSGHMQCLSGACQCRAGYRPILDKVARVLSCRNCETDTDCLSGATCLFQMRFTNARLCRCPDGKFGDGATACHECGAPGEEDRQRCGQNAVCEAMSTGRVCRCQYGYSGSNPRQGCVKDETRLMLNVTQLQLFEGQTDVGASCRVIRGPVRPANLVWTSAREVPIPVGEEGRVAQFLLGDRKVLHISRVTKSDARELYCLPDVEGERRGVETLKISVLDNPCRQCHPLAFCNYTLPGCQCSLGYTGDGVARCDKASCTEQQLCDPGTELCLYSSVSGRYGCECIQGLERIDGRCQKRREGCETSADCHANAECASLIDGRRQCRCREGFSGDGLRHCERSGPGCNFHNKCAKNAECAYSQAERKYRCVCSSGFFGNGDAECRQQAACAQCERDAGLCTFETIEHRTLDGRVEQVQLGVCRCLAGSQEVKSADDGRTVCKTPAQLNRTLYVALGDSIRRVPAEMSEASGDGGVFAAMSSATAEGASNAPRAGSLVVALDYNCRSREIFWSVYGHTQLYSAKADKAAEAGTRTWVPFGTGMEMVEGLAVDWTTGNVYYTAQYVSREEATKGSRFGEIGVIANRRGVAYKKVLFRGEKDGVVRPRGIAIDPFLGKIYYTDWDRKDPRIMSAYMNGESHSKLTSTPDLLPNDIIRRFDSTNEEVCFAAADHPLNKTALQAGSNSRPSSASQQPVQCVWRPVRTAEFVETRRYRTQWLGQPFGLAYAEGQFYWTNWRTNKLATYSERSGQIVDRGALGGPDSRLMGIVAVSSDCPTTGLPQKSDHACSENRDYGGCKYLCLAAPNGGVKCACPDDNPGCSP